MTFDEWWDLHTYGDLVRGVMQTAWNASITQNNKPLGYWHQDEAIKKEREACAHEAEIWDSEPLSGRSIAEIIRNREK